MGGEGPAFSHTSAWAKGVGRGRRCESKRGGGHPLLYVLPLLSWTMSSRTLTAVSELYSVAPYLIRRGSARPISHPRIARQTRERERKGVGRGSGRPILGGWTHRMGTRSVRPLPAE